MPAPATPAPTEPADLGSRLLALLVDVVVVVLLSLPLIGVSVQAGPPGSVEIALLWFVYRTIADATGGSLGKRLLGLTIVGFAGGRPGLGAGATRNLWSLSSLLPLMMPPAVGNGLAVGVSAVIAVSIARDGADRGVHDRLAGTSVRRPA